MSMFWMESGCFCPMDHGLLEQAEEITLKVYTCPSCRRQFVMMPGGGEVPISDGFVKPREVHICRKKPDFSPAMILEMVVPCARGSR